MTGSVLGEVTAPIGTWSVVQDGGAAGTPWGRITWNTEPQGSVPAGTGITVQARTADTEAGLAGATFTPVGNGTPFVGAGRYIEVRATLTASPAGASPVLSDLRIEALDRNGVFSCTATAVRIAVVSLGVANPADVPCVDDDELLATVNQNAGLVTVRAQVVEARTNLTPDNISSVLPAAGDSGAASARINSTRITVGLLVTIELGLIQSSAAATCTPGPGGLTPTFTSSSSIASLRVNGVSISVGSAPLTIPLVVGSLRLNSTVTTGTSVTRHAVILDTIATDVVLAEAKANVESAPGSPGGHPCQA
jgi:hypothetical protein